MSRKIILILLLMIGIAMSATTGKAYAGLDLEYTVTIEKGNDTVRVELKISNINAAYLPFEFRSEARDQNIGNYVSNLSAESSGSPLVITDIASGKWRINSPGSTVTLQYDIKKIVPYDWSHLWADNTEVAVYIDDEYGFLMGPFFFAYPFDTTNMSLEDISSVKIKFEIPDDWDILTLYSEEAGYFIVNQSGNNLLWSFINRQQIYMGKMKFYASKWVGNCKVQMGVPEGDDNIWELQTQQDVQDYVDATALVLAEYTRIFGDNPYSVYTMYPNFIENRQGRGYTFPGTRYFGNGYQYWSEHRRWDLVAHMALSFIYWFGDAPLKATYDIEKGVGEMYYGHTLAWSLFNDETDLGNMYYWYLVYDRMHGTSLTDHYEYTSYVKGEWVALLLDKRIQEETNDAKDLNTAMNVLYRKYKQTDHTVTYQDLQEEVESITGSDFSSFFSQYIDNDAKIPAYQYVEPYREYFLNLPATFENTYYLKLYGKTSPLFVLIEMATNLQEHVMAGVLYQTHLDEVAAYLLALYDIEAITEKNVEDALSELTNRNCAGFFDRWSNSFGRLSLTELKEWLSDYKNDTNTPRCATGSATSLTANSAILNGTINPNGAVTTYYFEYGTSSSYGSETEKTNTGSDANSIPVTIGLTGLNSNTTYYCRIVVTNSAGTIKGGQKSFTTSAVAPTVLTTAATLVTSTSATLNGAVNSNGKATTYYFEYGTDTGYGSATSSSNAGSGTTAVSVKAPISGLTSATTYNYRLLATNLDGTSYGDDKTLSTTILYVEPSGSCGANTPCYTTIQEAIDAAPSGATIKTAQGTYNEDLSLSSSKELTLSAGWDSTFTTKPSTSAVKSMTISDGGVTIDSIVIQ